MVAALTVMQRDHNARMPTWFDREAIEGNAKTFREILWRRRGEIPSPRDSDDEIDSLYTSQPALLSCVVADCLYILQQTLNEIGE